MRKVLVLALLWVVAALAVGSARAADMDVPVNLRLLNAARDNEWDNVLKALEDGGAINARNRVGDTVLNMAARRGRLDHTSMRSSPRAPTSTLRT